MAQHVRIGTRRPQWAEGRANSKCYKFWLSIGKLISDFTVEWNETSELWWLQIGNINDQVDEANAKKKELKGEIMQTMSDTDDIKADTVMVKGAKKKKKMAAFLDDDEDDAIPSTATDVAASAPFVLSFNPSLNSFARETTWYFTTWTETLV